MLKALGHILICTVLLLAAKPCVALASTDEVSKPGLPDQLTDDQSGHPILGGSLMPDERSVPGQIQPSTKLGYRTLLDHDSAGQITAGELWQFFNEQGLTSVDRLTLKVDYASELTEDNLGSIHFQIEDPGTGSFLTKIRVDGSNKLEIPLDYDYMKRFSADSTELIRLALPGDFSQSTAATISIEADSPLLTRLNVILFGGFIGFWLVLFYILNHFTKPLEEAAEDIIVRSVESFGDQDSQSKIQPETSTLRGTSESQGPGYSGTSESSQLTSKKKADSVKSSSVGAEIYSTR